MAFAAGWLLRVRPALFESVARCWKGAAVLALLAFLPIAWVEWNWPGDTRAPGWAIILFHVARRSEEHTSELQSLMRISSAVFCLKKQNKQTLHHVMRSE